MTSPPDREVAGPRVLRVGTGEYATIGAAIKAARDGDAVEIVGGRYTERIVLRKAVELRSVPDTGTVMLAHDVTPLTLRASAKVRGLTIVGELSGGDSFVDSAVVVEGAGVSPLLESCVVSVASPRAIWVMDGAALVVRDCSATGGVWVGNRGSRVELTRCVLETDLNTGGKCLRAGAGDGDGLPDHGGGHGHPGDRS